MKHTQTSPRMADGFTVELVTDGGIPASGRLCARVFDSSDRLIDFFQGSHSDVMFALRRCHASLGNRRSYVSTIRAC